MTETLQTFLSDVVDYAGYFPPSDLPLDDALHNYAAYRTGSDRWMLGRFVLFASQLDQISSQSERFEEQPPFRFSVLGSSTDHEEDFLEMIRNVRSNCSRFVREYGDQVRIEYLETKIAGHPEYRQSPRRIRASIEQTVTAFESRPGAPDTIFFETDIASTETWRNHLETLTDALAMIGETDLAGETGVECGFKLRCGGEAAVPSIRQVARTIATCHKKDIPMKCTAGLHHAIRGKDRGEEARPHHGYMNVIASSILCESEGFSPDELQEVLADTDADSFLFGESSFEWKDYQVERGDVETVRRVYLRSFGSCSFETPLEEARQFQ